MSIAPGNPVQVGDKIFILYTANTVVKDGARIGLAKVQRDRWAAIEPVSQVGVLQTRPMYWANRTLEVNADARRGSLRAELLDHYGKPIPGFTLADADRFSGNSFSQTMSWKGVRALPVERVGHAYAEGDQRGSGRLMSIRFYLDAAKLFSFSC